MSDERQMCEPCFTLEGGGCKCLPGTGGRRYRVPCWEWWYKLQCVSTSYVAGGVVICTKGGPPKFPSSSDCRRQAVWLVWVTSQRDKDAEESKTEKRKRGGAATGGFGALIKTVTA